MEEFVTSILAIQTCKHAGPPSSGACNAHVVFSQQYVGGDGTTACSARNWNRSPPFSSAMCLMFVIIEQVWRSFCAVCLYRQFGGHSCHPESETGCKGQGCAIHCGVFATRADRGCRRCGPRLSFSYGKHVVDLMEGICKVWEWLAWTQCCPSGPSMLSAVLHNVRTQS